MFDSNMAHLPKGFRFYADVGGVKGALHNLGLKCGDIVECHMLNEGSNNPCVDLIIDGKITTVQNYKEGSGEHYDRLVYSGNIDGSGFIEEDRFDIAKEQAKKNGKPFTHVPTKPFYIPSRKKQKQNQFAINYGRIQ